MYNNLFTTYLLYITIRTILDINNIKKVVLNDY